MPAGGLSFSQTGGKAGKRLLLPASELHAAITHINNAAPDLIVVTAELAKPPPAILSFDFFIMLIFLLLSADAECNGDASMIQEQAIGSVSIAGLESHCVR